ncbi:MAG: hypothetical protein HN904_09515, partial [Victivallales bacterium]|nr:hypothetical protein [Victivallales bacterium]
MKTRHRIISTGLAVALLGSLALSTQRAQAGDGRDVAVGALIGGALGYLIGGH